ncbi:MAG: hypothetical protein ACE5FD_19290 [Anaerolineae bacterium]
MKFADKRWWPRIMVRRTAVPPLVLGLVLIILTACNRINQQPTLGSQTTFPPQTEAILTCSQECAARSQCGDTVEQGTVVMGSGGGPATRFHELIFPAESRVTINGSDVRTLEPLIGGDQFELTFYHVTVIDSGKSGWIAGWCVAAP